MPFQSNDAVVRAAMRDIVGTVIRGPIFLNAQNWYSVRFGGTVHQVLESDLEPHVQASSIEDLIALEKYASHESLARRVTLKKLESPLRDAIYSLDAARTDFHAYQFKPLFKFLASERNRILIADEVGLGKTIEAGYILREQRARHDIDRVLIVCPAALRQKWQLELNRRFGERFEIFTAPTLRRWLAQDTGRERLAGIVSMQTLRGESLRDLLEEKAPLLDLLIVDEAHHHRNPETSQHKAIHLLATGSNGMVFLTATPMHLGNQDLFSLLRLLLPEEFDRLDVFQQRLAVNQHIVHAETALRNGGPQRVPQALSCLQQAAQAPDLFGFNENRLYQRLTSRLQEMASDDLPSVAEAQEDLSRLNLISHIVTRTKKRDAYPDAPVRQPRVLTVQLTEEERIAYHTTYEFCAEHYAETDGNWAAQFPLIMLQRQMASSIPALLEHYADRIGDDDADREDETTENQYDVREAPNTITPLVQIPGFGALIRELRSLPLEQQDTKLASLIQVLKTREKVIVFSYFRGSLLYLERRLRQAGIRCVRIDGSVPYNPENPEEDERQIRINQFKDPAGPRVLLSSEVGSEGLDFQFCSTLINWDLPWNPMVVEQRIGRLDRLGQKSPIISIYNFTSPGTIEDRILERLYKRVGLFEGAIGPLEPILGEAIRELTDELLVPKLTDEQIDELIDRKALALENQKRLEAQFDAEGEALIGLDDVFNDRIALTRQLGRYVTPAELELLVRDFLATEHPASQLRERTDGPGGRDAGEKSFWLNFTNELRNFVRQHSRRLDDPALLQFLGRGQNQLRVTFDPQAALASPVTEHLHNQHPLIKAIASFLAATPERIQPVCSVMLQTDLMPESDYAFYWAEVTEYGLQAGRSLWVEACLHDGSGRLHERAAEQLLFEMVVHGESWHGFEAPPAEAATSLVDQFQTWIGQRVIDRRHQATEQNEARVAVRLASLAASHRVRVSSVQARLDQLIADGKQRILPAVRGQIERMNATFEQRQRDLEASRAVNVEFQPGGFGFVTVRSLQQTGVIHV